MEGTTRKRLGRPPSPRGEVRGRRVVTFLTDDEFELVQTGAEQGQISLSRYLHDLLLEGMKHQHQEDRER